MNISSLTNLLPSHCSEHGCGKTVSVSSRLTGATLQLTFECSDGHVTKWSSSNNHSKTRSVINENDLLFAASILFSGNHYAKIKKFCSILELKCPTEKMYYRYQRLYLIPTINKFWKTSLDKVKER